MTLFAFNLTLPSPFAFRLPRITVYVFVGRLPAFTFGCLLRRSRFYRLGWMNLRALLVNAPSHVCVSPAGTLFAVCCHYLVCVWANSLRPVTYLQHVYLQFSRDAGFVALPLPDGWTLPCYHTPHLPGYKRWWVGLILAFLHRTHYLRVYAQDGLPVYAARHAAACTLRAPRYRCDADPGLFPTLPPRTTDW